MSRQSKILIIDDDEALLEALPVTLDFHLYRLDVDTTALPLHGVRKVQTEDYDAVLCDIRMSELDGMTVLKSIRSVKPQIPVILMTGHWSETLAAEASAAGAYACLAKPLDRSTLLTTVRRALALAHYRCTIEQ